MTVASWVTSATAALNTDFNTSSNLFTWRQVIPTADISNTGNAYTRAICRSSNTAALVIDKLYIGQAADAGDAYDYQAAPTELLFSGTHGFTLGTNAAATSDAASFTIPAGKNLVLSWYSSGGAGKQSMRICTKANWNVYFKSGDDTTTTNATGYTQQAAGSAFMINYIESGNDAAGGGFNFVVIAD